MVYYLKFSADEEPTQFTTALEAKEHIEAEMPEDGTVYFAFAEEAPESIDSLQFISFDEKETAREAIDDAQPENATPEGEGGASAPESPADDSA